MNNGFASSFENDKVDLLFIITYYGSGFAMYGFVVMDLEYVNNNNVGFSCVGSSSNCTSDVNLWNIRLSHIGQENIGHPAKAE